MFRSLRKLILPTVLLCAASTADAQLYFNRIDSVKVTSNSSLLPNPWSGGFNAPQWSNIDLDFDGVQDLIAFDRTDNKITTYLNVGSPGNPAFKHEPYYEALFPRMKNWVLLRDYNCDGKADIFTNSSGGMAVYRNTSINGVLSFSLVTELLNSFQPPNDVNLYVSSVDIPAIDDLDDDGDMDVVTFGILGSYVEYHRNYSVENGFGCDSLDFELRNRCWGYFSENASTNSVTLDDTCAFNVSNPELTEPTELRESRHAGSTLLTLDMDEDGDKELVLGDISFKNMVMLTNGGDPSFAYMTAQDASFPSNTTSVWQSMFPGGYHVDLDGDGIRELLVSPNTTALADNDASVWHYANSGTDDNPNFNLVEKDFLQNQMIDVGEGAYPVFFDHNQDGLLDIVVANYGYYDCAVGSYESKMALYENVGTANAPAYELITEDYESLGSVGMGLGLYPAFGDLDGDNDEDMMIGDLDGILYYFENIAPTGNDADFVLSQANYPDDVGNPIDVGQFATPQLFDIDDDGLLDLLIGERNGIVNYYQNIGSSNAPVFRFITDTLGRIFVNEWKGTAYDVTGYSVPHFFWNEDTLSCLVGSESGHLYLYDDIENNLSGDFNLVDSAFGSIHPGVRTAPAIAELNGDNDFEMLVGHYRGGVAFYGGTPTVGTAELSYPELLMNLFPNPANESLNIRISGAVGTEGQLMVTDVMGRIVYQQDTRGQHNLLLDIADYPAGTYFCVLDQSGIRTSKKFLVVR